jgi:putative alpha-1,2-mannosidase
MGQMSAWYVLSTIGVYQVAPGQNVWTIGSPQFSKVILHLDPSFNKGKDFVIETIHCSKSNKYIQSATLNGKPLNEPWFEHSEIVNGGKLIFTMGPKPNKNWGNEPQNAPPSMTVIEPQGMKIH